MLFKKITRQQVPDGDYEYDSLDDDEEDDNPPQARIAAPQANPTSHQTQHKADVILPERKDPFTNMVRTFMNSES